MSVAVTDLTFGSLFAGIGGLDLGLERAGWECRWQVEIDDYCRRVLAKHWPHVPRLADVREIDGPELERVGLVCGGFPCQPVSNAGLQKGEDDPRWLWPEFRRIVGILRPRYVLVENVPGLLRRGLSRVLGDLWALGYDAEWETIPAAAFGAPHLRHRVFVAAYPNGGRGRGEPLYEPWGVQAPYAISDGARSPPAPVSDTYRDRQQQPPRLISQERRRACDGRAGDREVAVGDSHRDLLEEPRIFPTEFRAPETSWWKVEPQVGRVVDGFPGRVDQLRGLGNAVIPIVGEWLGALIRHDAEMGVLG